MSRAPSFSAPGLLGNVRAMRTTPLEFLPAVRRACGPVARFRLGPYVAHLASDPEGVKHVLVDHTKIYDRDMRQFEVIGLALGQGLLTTSGDFWLQQRRLAAPAFHRQRLSGLALAMSQTLVPILDGLAPRAGERPGEGTVFDLAHFMFELSFEVILRTMFATELPVSKAEIGAAIEHMITYVDHAMMAPIALPLAVPTPRNRGFLRARAVVDGICRHLIAERHAGASSSAPVDLLAFLMDARDEETGVALSDTQLVDEVKSILLAGHETVANALTWTFQLLAGAPEIRARLVAEIDQGLGGAPPTLEACAKMPFLGMVIKEVLRLYPPGWLIGRNTASDDELGGFVIPKRSMMFVVPYVTHRLETYWPEPERFDPERFTPEREAARPRYAYCPFGAGPHVCIGQGFALLEMQLAIAGILQRYEVELAGSGPAVPNPRITLGVRGGLPVRLRKRA